MRPEDLDARPTWTFAEIDQRLKYGVEVMRVLFHVRPETSLHVIQYLLSPPEEAAALYWPEIAQRGWILTPRYVEGPLGGPLYGDDTKKHKPVAIYGIGWNWRAVDHGMAEICVT